jgi:hypothetical protein
MAERRADEGMRQGGKGIKRRGILAAAGAAVAGIVAKQTAQPVLAADVVLGQYNVASTGTTVVSTAADEPGICGVFWPGGSGTVIARYPAGVYGLCGLASASSPTYGVAGYADIPFGVGVQGTSLSYYGVQGVTDNGVGAIGDVKAGGNGTSNIGVIGRVGVLEANGRSNTVAVYGQNAATGAGGIGVQGTCSNGLGGSFQGGVAPVRLVPGSQSARTLSAVGHQAGELYFTSDNRLFVFDGTNWREVLLAAPGSGVPPAAAARASSAGTATTPVQPLPPPRP